MQFLSKTVAAASAAFILFGVQASHAATETFVADLVGTNEVPPNGSPGIGFAIVTLNDDTLHVQEIFNGLLSPTTASHIHCCLAFPFQTGATAMVATTLPTFPGFPLGVKTGTYDMTFSLLDPASYNPVFVANHGNTITGPTGAEAALIAGLLAGETYINIHTQEFPGGEIRGLLAPLVPLPSALPLFATGLAGLGLLGWRRKRNLKQPDLLGV